MALLYDLLEQLVKYQFSRHRRFCLAKLTPVRKAAGRLHRQARLKDGRRRWPSPSNGNPKGSFLVRPVDGPRRVSFGKLENVRVQILVKFQIISFDIGDPLRFPTPDLSFDGKARL